MSAELRNFVYGLVITRGRPIMATKKRRMRNQARGQWNESASLRVCRQVRNEALPIFYHRKTFRFHVRDLRTMPLAVRSHAAKLKNIQVKLPSRTYIAIYLNSGLRDYKMNFFEIWTRGQKNKPQHKLLDSEMHQRQLAINLLAEAVARGEKAMSRRLLEDLLNMFRTRPEPGTFSTK